MAYMAKLRKCVLLLGGSFNPIHMGHVEAMNVAKKHLEKKGFNVLKGHLIVALDEWVNAKCPKEAIPASIRIEICDAAVKDIDWLSTVKKPFDSVKQFAKLEYSETNIIPFMVCGSDQLGSPYCKYDGLTHPVFVSRDENTKTSTKTSTKTKTKHMLTTDKSKLSSTYIRDRIRESSLLGDTYMKLMQDEVIDANVMKYLIFNRQKLEKAVPYLFKK